MRVDRGDGQADDVPDLIGRDMQVLFCGINPGQRSAELHQHFARPGNRFWKLLHAGGFTEREMLPSEQALLPAMGIGITNLVARSTVAASEVTADELRAGAAQLEEKVRRWRPGTVAILGMQAYRTGFRRPKAAIGLQPELVASTPIWLLPNPSGLQARYQMPEMAALFTQLHDAVAGGH
jgi:TDG/mug DNA glycosylase family protein